MSRCDMHVHSFYSGKTNHVKALEPMDSYNKPAQIYKTAKSRGMDFVTITDHDHIEGCLDFLNANPEVSDFFISEEITIFMDKWDFTIHLGAYDINEEQHKNIQRLRSDFEELLLYLEEQNIFYVWNHPFYHFPRGSKGREFLLYLLDRFGVFEGINSSIPPDLNDVFREGAVKVVPEIFNKIPIFIAGSDSHSIKRIASSWTEAQGKTPAEFLNSIRRGDVQIYGNDGAYTGVFGDAMSVYFGYIKDLLSNGRVHKEWSFFKRIRNEIGWLLWLPVFTIGSYLWASIQFWQFEQRTEEYKKIWNSIA